MIDSTNRSGEDKEAIFRRLHYADKMLIVPSIGNSMSAALIEYAGFPAVATSGIAVADAHGFASPGQMPFHMLLRILHRIIETVDIPVSADIADGYADDDIKLRENIARVLDTGIAGINFEDSHIAEQRMYPVDEQCRRIALIRETAVREGRPLFINAQINVYIYGDGVVHPAAIEEVILRGRAYIEAGADGIFPDLVGTEEQIATLAENIPAPLTVTITPGMPPLEVLDKQGVARLSIGAMPNVALSDIRSFARELHAFRGIEKLKTTSKNI